MSVNHDVGLYTTVNRCTRHASMNCYSTKSQDSSHILYFNII